MLRFAASLLALFLACSALAADLPKRKSGLWEMKMITADMPALSSQMCVDQKTDDLLASEHQEKMSCTKNDVRRDGGKVVVDSVCKIEGITATTHSVIFGNFDSAYRVESKSTYNPPLAGLKEGNVVIDAKWLGPCKTGQKPGDVVTPGAGGFNLEELMKKAPK